MISRHIAITSILASALFIACSTPGKDAMQRDPHSFANHNDVRVKHFDLDLTVDFTTKTLRGWVNLHVEPDRGVGQLILDTRDITVEKVVLDDNAETPFTLGEEVEHLGRSLTIAIRPETQRVKVYYSTSPQAAAVQWLEPAQTAGGKLPFLFTQSQAILARTWIPCQDNPAVRSTYNARIRVPPGMLALMSAENGTEKRADGVYTFSMPQPIPSYLFALAVGDIGFKAISERCGVFAEPSVLEKAAWEFQDTEKMIKEAEALYGPYRWGRYDILVLPPSFPFGGMENPRLTFATPTILAGDRSLVALVAHELAHSWSGNLVTNASWADFWLNEGFTTYFEGRIMEAVYGKDYAEMQALLGYQDLGNTITELGKEHQDTRLKLDLTGRDPDDGVTDIAYEKGRFFLRLIEETVGRERWDAFLRSYFDTYAFTTMTTDKFLTILRKDLIKGDRELEEQLGIDWWVFGTGLPLNCPVPQSDALTKVEEQLGAWNSGTPASALLTSGWTTQEWLHFVRSLPRPLSTDRMAELDAAFRFTQSGNSEILCEWLIQSVASGYAPADAALEKFLTTVGRRKFLRPLYIELAKSSEGLARARQIYARARPGYHAVSTRTIDEILQWEDWTAVKSM